MRFGKNASFLLLLFYIIMLLLFYIINPTLSSNEIKDIQKKQKSNTVISS